VNHRLLRNNYLIINLIFTAILVSVILYSLVFSARGMKHPIPSGWEWLSGGSSPSTGLSRSFSAIVRLNVAEARQFNPYGIRIFAFFAVQLVIRAFLSVLLLRPGQFRLKGLVIADVLFSVLFFVFSFWPFFLLMGRQLGVLLR
jgi:hypothetical protein